MSERPTGFVATCQCGNTVGAMDFDRTDRSEAGKILSRWLMKGCTVEPRFGFEWSESITPCACVAALTPTPEQEPSDG